MYQTATGETTVPDTQNNVEASFNLHILVLEKNCRELEM